MKQNELVAQSKQIIDEVLDRKSIQDLLVFGLQVSTMCNELNTGQAKFVCACINYFILTKLQEKGFEYGQIITQRMAEVQGNEGASEADQGAKETRGGTKESQS